MRPFRRRCWSAATSSCRVSSAAHSSTSQSSFLGAGCVDPHIRDEHRCRAVARDAFALLGIATTGWLAWVLFSGGPDKARPPVHWVAATCYATMVLPFLLAQAPVHDMALVPFTNLAIGFLWRARWDLGRGTWDLGFAAIALGLSMLTKGLEGVAIVGLGYGVYLLLTRAMTLRIVLQGVTVLAIAALVALPWYLAMEAREPGYLRYTSSIGTCLDSQPTRSVITDSRGGSIFRLSLAGGCRGFCFSTRVRQVLKACLAEALATSCFCGRGSPARSCC